MGVKKTQTTRRRKFTHPGKLETCLLMVCAVSQDRASTGQHLALPLAWVRLWGSMLGKQSVGWAELD